MIPGLIAMFAIAVIGFMGENRELRKTEVVKRVPVERLLSCTLIGKEIRCQRP